VSSINSKPSRRTLLKLIDVQTNAIWQGYVTLLRFPIDLRDRYQSELSAMREALAVSLSKTEEDVQGKAEEWAIKMGEIK